MAPAEVTPPEKAKVEVIAARLNAWGDSTAVGMKLATNIADECVIRMDDSTPSPTAFHAAVSMADTGERSGTVKTRAYRRFGLL